MKGVLIYKCRHCGVTVYHGETAEYYLDHDFIATMRISEDGECKKVPQTIWHQCFENSIIALPQNYHGMCDLVGVQEAVPKKEEDEDDARG